ncbi:MAG: hypothetical protein ACR2RD_05170 [Woeseiaceae bacterium]
MTHADEQQMRETLVSTYRELLEMGLTDLLTEEQWGEFFGRAKKVAYSKFI